MADDIWALGMTMVEALTQRVLPLSDERSVAAQLPTTLPSAFADTIKRCLNRDPAGRPTALDLEAQFTRSPPTAEIAAPQPVLQRNRTGAILPRDLRNPRVLASIAAAFLVVSGAVWVGLRVTQNQHNFPSPAARPAQPSLAPSDGAPAVASHTPQIAVATPPGSSARVDTGRSKRSESAPAPPVAPLSNRRAQPPTDVTQFVVHEQIPVVPRSALETIHGHVKVAVLVIVDPSGGVVDALLQDPGPSMYFARLAREAASKWKFAPAETRDSRRWLLRFEFGRDGTTVHANIQPSQV
jgi:serine/threonine protein kinase